MAYRLKPRNEAVVAERLQRWSTVQSSNETAETMASQPDGVKTDGISSSSGPRIVHLIQVPPFLHLTPDIVYDYTIPELSDRTVAALYGDRHRTEVPYRGYRFPHVGYVGPKDPMQHLQPFEAAQLLSGIYAGCVDPMRFESRGTGTLTKADVFEAFARRLSSDRVASAVESIATGLDEIRALDQYQPGIGTATARWMQYLARETLETAPWGRLPHAPIQQRNAQAALATIRNSVTAVDKFTALGRRAV